MSEIALASINTFGIPSPKADFVPPSEEQIFVLTASQLSDLITAAVEKAVQPLQDRVEALEERAASQAEKIASLEDTQETQAENQLIQLRLIGQLREAAKKVPQPLQKDRGDILRALLAANGGKMLRSQARKKMHLSESRFSELLATMGDYIETRPYHLNESWKVLVIR